MINRQRLLNDLQELLRSLEADLLERSESADVPEVVAALKEEHEEAKKAERTALNYEDWRSDYITQIAAAWVLSCVFVRFLEDNRLVDPPKISGPTGSGQSSGNTDNWQLATGNSRLDRARDEHTMFFQDRERATQTDREYLLDVFGELAKLPGAKEIFGQHNPVWQLPNWLSGDAAGELLRYFQRIDADTGTLVHDFTDPQWDTRFLGDLYQDLSQAARKKYALLQTPEFVEEFILDRTLDPALDEFGLEGFKMIDPACGSGHFLLGAFPRIFDRWCREDPGAKCRVVAQRTLDSIYGVDLNPFAVAIARFRLLLEALKACGVLRLSKAPAFELNLACGDSLYHGREAQQTLPGVETDESHYFHTEDAPALRRMLREGTYHCVVANPPYITPKDRAANNAYRRLYTSCHMKYSLSVPFMERIFRLAVKESLTQSRKDAKAEETDLSALAPWREASGYTGQITANSFMKREFGKKLIEQFLPTVDLTHVIDTSGAYIPGHGTPTLIMFGRNRKPVAQTIRTAMGIRGEPATPADSARGQVWSAILEQIDQSGSESDFISVDDSSRQLFSKHPWSIGGGGSAELKQQLESRSGHSLSRVAESVGFMAITGEDDIFVAPANSWIRFQSPYLGFAVGDGVRDWQVTTSSAVSFMYEMDDPRLRVRPIGSCGKLGAVFWPYRTNLRNRVMFGKTPSESGLTWYEYRFRSDERVRAPLCIVYGEVATHNHFVLDRGGKVFKQTAPVIKLPSDATEDDHLALLGLLNSSTACFWMKQVCHNKGAGGGTRVEAGLSTLGEDMWECHYAFNGSNLRSFPLPTDSPLPLSRRLDSLAGQLSEVTPAAVLSRRREEENGEQDEDRRAIVPLREALSEAKAEFDRLRGLMVYWQEELDWQCYQLYGLLDAKDAHGPCSLITDDLENETTEHALTIQPGQRAFEIVMARRMEAGELETTWFTRHRNRPITDLPGEWPDSYRQRVDRRIELIEKDRTIRLVEQPEYKRRWNTEPWESQLERALQSCLLDRMESYFDFDGRMNLGGSPTAKLEIGLTTVARLADVARQDPLFMDVAEVYRDDPAFDVQGLLEELVAEESVPLLPVLRYKPSGLRKRAEWERTWQLQRAEDGVTSHSSLVIGKHAHNQEPITNNQEPTTSVPVPPKYKSSDFLKGSYWRLRGKLDVPKERWVSFPHCEGEDGTLVIAWAGYDHLQLARAISAYYVDVQERLGGRDDPRLVPLLACLIELLPWLKQWHNEVDPEFGMAMGDYFEGFVNEEARNLPRPEGGTGWTLDEIKGWQPPKKTKKKAARKKKG